MMADDLTRLATDVASKIGDAEILADKFFPALRVPVGQLLATVTLLKEDYQLSHLSNMTAVDYPADHEFELIYHFYSFHDNRKFLLKSRIPRDQPKAPSVVGLYPTADWQEREVYDLFGIVFQGHPNLLRVLLPDTFKGHPLRKDFVKKGVRR